MRNPSMEGSCSMTHKKSHGSQTSLDEGQSSSRGVNHFFLVFSFCFEKPSVFCPHKQIWNVCKAFYLFIGNPAMPRKSATDYWSPLRHPISPICFSSWLCNPNISRTDFDSLLPSSGLLVDHTCNFSHLSKKSLWQKSLSSGFLPYLLLCILFFIEFFLILEPIMAAP